MINAIPDLAPQQAVVETSSASAKQSGSPERSFTDVLSAAVSGDQATPAAKSDAPRTEGKSNEDEPAEAVDLAGAVQAAMAVPVQPAPAAVVQDAPQATGIQVVEAVQSDQVQIPTVEQPDPRQSPSTQVDEVVQQVGGKAQQGSVATLEPPRAEPASAKTASPVPTPAQAETSQQTVSAATVAQATSAGSWVESQVQTGQIAQQAQPMAAELDPDESSDAPAAKPDERRTANKGATDASPRAQASSVPIETVPVQWRFDGSSQSPRMITGTAAAELAQSVSDLASRPAGGESSSASGQGSTDSQGAATMGLQSTAQLREAAQRIAPASSGSDLPTRVIDQVVREVSLSRIDGRSNLVVKLNPPDLGNLQLRITQDATGMTTHIQASTSQVRGLLEAHMPALMDSFAKAGLQMDAVSVSVGTSFSAFAGNAQQQDTQPNSSQTRQQFVSNGRPGGVGTIADASYPMWGKSEQVGYSWLA